MEPYFMIWVVIGIVYLGLAIMRIDWRIRQIAVLMAHYHKDTTRCPECDHPAIGASFCEETTYFCPQCGEKFIWKSKNGKYILSASINGDEHA
jgi:predicted RNA-binding Zn-ribbon protein involved in translation (DUF1610 family)